MKKWIGLSLGTLIGISHVGMIGMIARRDSFPQLNLPIGQYTAYTVQANKDGYMINYRAHDPRVMATIKKVDRPGGFLGLGKTKAITERQYLANPISSDSEGGLSAKKIACIKAQGAGESTGRLVGGGLGTAAVTQTGMASIPIIGWVLAGATTMMGMDQGAEIGGSMAKDFNDCEPDVDEEIAK
jgi:hypothetical protein|tara:strand:+ start:566 stop:1120 length:555 start_codon:yes stop_codon:yes gene_type:complete